MQAKSANSTGKIPQGGESEKSLKAFWSMPASDLVQRLQTTSQGLSVDVARRRLESCGTNLLKPKKRSDSPTILLSQFKSPIILILVIAAALSIFLGEKVSATIILTIVLISAILSFLQERRATKAVQKLLGIVQIKVAVLRDGTQSEIPLEKVVPGDVVVIGAGDIIPGDCLILESKDLFVDEAALTGETYPVEKMIGVLPLETPLSQRNNALFMGTHAVSGSARAVVVETGKETEFGKVSERLRVRAPETEFEHGVRRFGYLLMEVTLLLVISIFAINVYFNRPVLDSFLFALALAVGLTPQLLPAIISVNLSHGAKRMANHKVIVKRLASIENFGSMNVLCSDKTGTLTEGVARVRSYVDVDGKGNEKVLFYAYLNSIHVTGFKNLMDEAIRSEKKFDTSGYQKLDEVPYDFVRKRLSILLQKGRQRFLVTKGALSNVLEICSKAETSSGVKNIFEVEEKIKQQYEDLSQQGLRILGVAYRDPYPGTSITKNQEAAMTFLGFVVFYDPPKSGVGETIGRLKRLGVSLKIITGDNRFVAANVSKQVGISNPSVLTGSEIRRMSDEALLKRVNDVDVFAEVEPNQKERIISDLRKVGNVVGYMGDGINDASALHAADVGISVDGAVDVAKEAADIVLLKKDLGVLRQGVEEGRRTFANTLKYVFMATSANFGNMFSMAGASLFLDYLPLLPMQILLMNLMTDFPEMAISTDSVDREMVDKPRRWDIKFIRRFMLAFGVLSSVFDYLTFGALLFILSAGMKEFRTGWFLESVISAALIVLVIRTRRPSFRSKPGRNLMIATLAVIGATLVIPYTPRLGELLNFTSIPAEFILLLLGILALYFIGAEATKKAFYRWVKF
jgi:Mg2+-importing ATPase